MEKGRIRWVRKMDGAFIGRGEMTLDVCLLGMGILGTLLGFGTVFLLFNDEILCRLMLCLVQSGEAACGWLQPVSFVIF